MIGRCRLVALATVEVVGVIDPLLHSMAQLKDTRGRSQLPTRLNFRATQTAEVVLQKTYLATSVLGLVSICVDYMVCWSRFTQSCLWFIG